jgi:integrase
LGRWKTQKNNNFFLNDNCVLINHLDKNGYPIKSFNYITSEYEPPVFFVELEEILRLINFKFNEPYLERVRDLFIFMCFTGQRISDSIRIRWTNLTTLNNAKVWIITTKKTSETINVPIPDFAMDVLGKYQDSNNPIPVMSEQYFNRRLKEMAELAGLDRTILIKKIIKARY